MTKKQVSILVLATVFSVPCFAHCNSDADPACWGLSSQTVAVTAISTYAPLISSGLYGLYKTEVVKSTAIEAAEYLQDGQVGPNLQAIFNLNPDIDREEIVDRVLELAEQL